MFLLFTYAHRPNNWHCKYIKYQYQCNCSSSTVVMIYVKKTRGAWQSQTWGHPAPQVRVQTQFSYWKFLSQQRHLPNDYVNSILEPRGIRNCVRLQCTSTSGVSISVPIRFLALGNFWGGPSKSCTRVTHWHRLPIPSPNGVPPPKKINRENLKFGLKLSVWASITSGLVGISSPKFSRRRGELWA